MVYKVHFTANAANTYRHKIKQNIEDLAFTVAEFFILNVFAG